jgi:hypothetical protein
MKEEMDTTAQIIPPFIQIPLKVQSAKPPKADKPPKPDKTPPLSTSPQSNSPLSDPMLKKTYLALNVIGCLLIVLGVGLGVTVIIFCIKVRRQFK